MCSETHFSSNYQERNAIYYYRLLLKGLCHFLLVHFAYNPNDMSFLDTELAKSLVNDKITALCHISMSPIALYQNVTNTKRDHFGKLIG